MTFRALGLLALALTGCGGHSDERSAFTEGTSSGPGTVKGEVTNPTAIQGACHFEHVQVEDGGLSPFGNWECDNGGRCYDLSAFSIIGEYCENGVVCPVCSRQPPETFLTCPASYRLFAQLRIPETIVCTRI
jgi:hypothetical protein